MRARADEGPSHTAELAPVLTAWIRELKQVMINVFLTRVWRYKHVYNHLPHSHLNHHQSGGCGGGGALQPSETAVRPGARGWGKFRGRLPRCSAIAVMPCHLSFESCHDERGCRWTHELYLAVGGHVGSARVRG